MKFYTVILACLFSSGGFIQPAAASLLGATATLSIETEGNSGVLPPAPQTQVIGTDTEFNWFPISQAGTERSGIEFDLDSDMLNITFSTTHSNVTYGGVTTFNFDLDWPEDLGLILSVEVLKDFDYAIFARNQFEVIQVDQNSFQLVFDGLAFGLVGRHSNRFSEDTLTLKITSASLSQR